MGGTSAEREISIQTGSGVMRALQELGYEAQSLDYDARFVDALREIAPDVVFNALHGPGGENGQIQGVLEYLNVPYTGSGIEAAALAMDKHLTKKLCAAEGLPTAAWDLFDLTGGTLPLLPGSLDLPLVVKPRYEGSSEGVTIVRTHEQWSAAMIYAAEEYTEILAEEFLPGREFTCGVLGEEALPVIEIVANRDEFYTYEAKYAPGGSTHIIPARISETAADRARAFAARCHLALGCRGMCRVDMIVADDDVPYVLEVNTIPGMTPTSLLPEAAREAGIGFSELLDRIIGYALEDGQFTPPMRPDSSLRSE